MEDKLRLNTALWGGFEGIIGRRDYFLNRVYIWSIGLLISLPYMIWTGRNAESLYDYLNPSAMFLSSPFLLKLWILLGSIGIAVLSISNLCRRNNDINGKIVKEMNIILSCFIAISALSMILPLQFTLTVGLVTIIILMVMLFKSGKITSQYPYDFTKEFNWGAFIGTWIWGLFNKSYIPLLNLIVAFTPWSLYFALYCGLKGNEWAFRNKNWDDVEKFNKSQEKQTTVFAILFVVLLPIIYFIIVAAIIAVLTFAVIKDEQAAASAPKGQPRVETTAEKIEKFATGFGNLYFESHEITQTENKYYVLPSDWKSYSFSDKKDVIEAAATLAAVERTKINNKSDSKCGCSSSTKAKELPRTKIYSSTDGQLLGEFIIDERELENASIKEIIKATLKAYRFYNPQ